MELNVDQALQRGVAAHNAGNLQEAERLYRSILQVLPTHADVNHNLGLISVSVNNAKEALPLFKRALEANPRIEQFWYSYIDALAKESDIKNARLAIKKAKKHGFDSKKLEALLLHSNVPAVSEVPSQAQLISLVEYYQNGQYEDAERSALLLTNQFPRHNFSWKILGAVLKNTGRLSEAVFTGRKAVEINPNDAEAHYNFGNTLKELGRLEESGVSYRQAIALQPDYADAYYNLGGMLHELDRFKEAEASYRRAILLKSDFAESHSNLGNTLQELGRLEEAEASYKLAIAVNPYYSEAYSNFGIMLKGLNRLKEAEASYRKAIELKPTYAGTHNNLGILLSELDKLGEAEACYRQAMALSPDYADAHSNLGSVLIKHGRIDEAEASYRQAIALQPDCADAYYNLGNMLKDLGRLDEAKASYRAAIEVKPDFAEARHVLAALTGETSNSAPRVYVENLFDRYASKFDHALVNSLQYKMPEMIVEMILKNHPSGTLGSILDLGCGTGLTGVEIKDYCTKLEGIDLSNRMLDEARKKNAYGRLTCRDIVDYLSTEDLNFDYFISTDVFIYVGDLSDVFKLIKSRNRSGGKLVFSTEHTDKDEFFLEKSGRYSHSKAYIQRLCEKFNYKFSHFEIVNLRKEKSIILNGGLYLLDF